MSYNSIIRGTAFYKAIYQIIEDKYENDNIKCSGSRLFIFWGVDDDLPCRWHDMFHELPKES